MSKERIFDLEQRAFEGDPFDTVEKCRIYDRDIRSSMIIPMQHMLALIKPHCMPGKSMLDVGCGSGLLALRLAGLHPEIEVYGVESNECFISVIQENLIFANLVGYRGNFHYEWGRPEKLPIEDASIDVVFSFCALHRWEHPVSMLRECRRVCKPDGLVLLYDLARDAEDGMVSFVLQYSGTGDADFMTALRASYTLDEMASALKKAGLEGWQVASEAINMIVTSRPMDVSYSAGEQSIYENIFQRDGASA